MTLFNALLSMCAFTLTLSLLVMVMAHNLAWIARKFIKALTQMEESIL